MTTKTLTSDNGTVMLTTDKPQLKGKLLTVYIQEDGTFIVDEGTADYKLDTLKDVKVNLKELVKAWENMGTEELKVFVSDIIGWEK